jgi:nucleoid-associated protein YgaU
MKPEVTFRQVDPKGGTNVTAELGQGYAVPTVGGGWQVVSRPKRKGMSDYQGADPISQDVPVVFDGTQGEVSQEASIRRLYEIMEKKVGPRDEPAVIEVVGVPIPYHWKHWVINAISRADEIRRSSDGNLIQAAMTVTLMEYVSGDVVIRRTPAKKSKKKSGNSSAKTYTTKTGDTLERIAAKEYGKSSDWRKIADANNLRDGSKKLKAGIKLKIPK